MRRDDDGYVLVSALSLLIFIAVLTAAISTIARRQVQSAAITSSRVQLQLAADGVARVLAVRSTRPQAGISPVLPDDGRWMSCALDDETTIAVSVSDVAGLIDLNAAPQSVLIDLLRSAGASRDLATALGAAILDYRDRDDTPEKGGAERKEYAMQGLPFGPKNAPFDATGELEQVAGMPPELFHRIRPLVTVFSHQPAIDAGVAPPILRQILGAASQPSGGGSRGRAFAIVVKAVGRTGVTATRNSVVEAVPQSPAGFVFREWSTGILSDGDVGAIAKPSLACGWFAR